MNECQYIRIISRVRKLFYFFELGFISSACNKACVLSFRLLLNTQMTKVLDTLLWYVCLTFILVPTVYPVDLDSFLWINSLLTFQLFYFPHYFFPVSHLPRPCLMIVDVFVFGEFAIVFIGYVCCCV